MFTVIPVCYVCQKDQERLEAALNQQLKRGLICMHSYKRKFAENIVLEDVSLP